MPKASTTSGNFNISVGAIVGFCAVVMSMIVLAGYPEEVAMLAAIVLAIGVSWLRTRVGTET